MHLVLKPEAWHVIMKNLADYKFLDLKTKVGDLAVKEVGDFS